MMKWVIRGSRAVMMGLAWACVWVPIGALIGARIDGELDPPHIAGPLYASLVCGAWFSVVAGIATERRRMDDLTPAFGGAFGALSGLLGGVVFAALVFLGDQWDTNWMLVGAVAGALTAICAVSGAGSAMAARLLRPQVEVEGDS